MTSTRRANRPRIRLLSYNTGSASARLVAEAADLIRLKERTEFRPRPTDIIVNWGSHVYPNSEFNIVGTAPRFINNPQAVYRARDKREALRIMTEAGAPAVEYTVDIAVAAQWYREGHVVVQRNTATGQAGAGIVICDPTLTVNAVPPNGRGVLWTKYFKRRWEFRVHVWGNQAIDIQQKRKRSGREDVDNRVRSYDNGWVFCRENVVCPEGVVLASVSAVLALGLDFGAVDVGWNDRHQTPAVFEVNTAPGIEGTTVERYATKIKELVA